MPSLALYQPEIAQNLGAATRIAACFDAEVHVIEPCGFPWRERDIRKVALDYQAVLTRHRDWDNFTGAIDGRVVLLTTRGETAHHAFDFDDSDILLLGMESAGVPAEIHDAADARIRIPLSPKARSLNVSVAGAIVLAEASRQLDRFS
ncbi:MAG: TrmH family RNA methyltransferase [Pseudomonadota bacterium]